ncbi:MAG: hypothetical protein PVH52_00605 [bacterium]|jgi:hypothetical protein
MKRVVPIFFAVLLLAAAGHVLAAQGGTSVPVGALEARDTPGDEGHSITLTWQSDATALVMVMRSTSPESGYEEIGDALAMDGTYVDMSAVDGVEYYYRLAAATDADTLYGAIAGPVVSTSNWFRTRRVNTLILTILLFVLVAGYIQLARRGKELFIRRIAGLSAIDEAIGRATEMGRKMFYIPGILSLSEIQTIASLYILGHVAKKTATYGASLECPNIDPLTFTAARETVQQAYMEAGKPDQFKDEMVTYITYDQFAYTASVTGKMVRERPATNFFIGSFFAESLILAETGQSVGAIQIAGTAELAQLPFFVTTCDYTLIGEELYAASAYLSKEPLLLGTIKAQDTIKAILMITMAVGIIVLALGSDIVRRLLETH